MISKSSIWLGLGLGLMAGVVGAEDKPLAKAPVKDPVKEELTALAAQYSRGESTVGSMAKERDRLALQAQAAIIGLKDAQLQMEQAISAGRFACGRLGKELDTAGTVWECKAPKPDVKEIPKK